MSAFTDLKTRFNTLLRDTENQTFTDDEKTELLTVALNDPYVYKVTRDTSLTTAAGTYTFNLPTGIEEVYDLYLDIDGTGVGQHISASEYDVVDGTIRLRNTGLPTGKTIILVGKTKLDTSSTTYPTKVQEYVLEMALIAAFEMLKTSKTTFFVINDITMGDLINSTNTHRQRAAELRKELTNQRLVTL